MSAVDRELFEAAQRERRLTRLSRALAAVLGLTPLLGFGVASAALQLAAR